MTKLARKNQEIFAGATGVTGVLGIFGSYAAAASDYSNDPDDIQGLAAYGAGIGSSIIANCPPFLEEMNALFYLISRQIAYLMQAGIPEYNADTTYYIGSVVNDATGSIFISTDDDNIGNDLDDESKWMVWITTNIRTVTANLDYVLYDDMTILAGPTTDAYPILIILPAATSYNKGRLVIIKKMYASGTGSLQIQVADSGTIDGLSTKTITAQYTSTRLISDGSQWLVA